MTKSKPAQGFDAKIANQVGKLTALIEEQKSREEKRKAAAASAVKKAFALWLERAPAADCHGFVSMLAETATKRNKVLIQEFLDAVDVVDVEGGMTAEPTGTKSIDASVEQAPIMGSQ